MSGFSKIEQTDKIFTFYKTISKTDPWIHNENFEKCVVINWHPTGRVIYLDLNILPDRLDLGS